MELLLFIILFFTALSFLQTLLPKLTKPTIPEEEPLDTFDISTLPTISTNDSNQFISAEEKAHYLKSRRWAILRGFKIRLCGNKCEVCQTTGQLHLHHLTYTTLTQESLSDVVLLCPECHQRQHDHYGYDRMTTYYPLILKDTI